MSDNTRNNHDKGPSFTARPQQHILPTPPSEKVPDQHRFSRLRRSKSSHNCGDSLPDENQSVQANRARSYSSHNPQRPNMAHRHRRYLLRRNSCFDGSPDQIACSPSSVGSSMSWGLLPSDFPPSQRASSLARQKSDDRMSAVSGETHDEDGVILSSPTGGQGNAYLPAIQLSRNVSPDLFSNGSRQRSGSSGTCSSRESKSDETISSDCSLSSANQHNLPRRGLQRRASSSSTLASTPSRGSVSVRQCSFSRVASQDGILEVEQENNYSSAANVHPTNTTYLNPTNATYPHSTGVSRHLDPLTARSPSSGFVMSSPYPESLDRAGSPEFEEQKHQDDAAARPPATYIAAGANPPPTPTYQTDDIHEWMQHVRNKNTKKASAYPPQTYEHFGHPATSASSGHLKKPINIVVNQPVFSKDDPHHKPTHRPVPVPRSTNNSPTNSDEQHTNQASPSSSSGQVHNFALWTNAKNKQRSTKTADATMSPSSRGEQPTRQQPKAPQQQTSNPILTASNPTTKLDSSLESLTTTSKYSKRGSPVMSRRRYHEPSSSSAKPRKFEWTKGEAIGSGTFGEVFKGLNQLTGGLFAVKQVPVQYDDGHGDQQVQQQFSTLQKEIAVMKDLDHPNIVRYMGSELDEHNGVFNIFLEYVSGGSLASVLSQFGPLKEPLVQKYTAHIVQGITYLHEKSIIHRDIKGANVLVSESGVAKLADFGCSKQFQGLVTSQMDESLKALRGSIPWMAPEVVLQKGMGRKADIWSVGCTVIEMLTAQQPWPEFHNKLQALFKIGTLKTHPPIPPSVTGVTLSFLKACFVINPDCRASGKQLMQHEYLRDVTRAEEPHMPTEWEQH